MYNKHLVQAYIQIKKAYALANRTQGKLEAPVCRAIVEASDEILSQKTSHKIFTRTTSLCIWYRH